MSKVTSRSDRFPPPLTGSIAHAAIAATVSFCLANYAYHYDALPESIRQATWGYFLAVQLPFGLVLPSTLLGVRLRQTAGRPSSIGVWLGTRDMIGAVTALAAGGLMVLLAVGSESFASENVVRTGTLFAQLLVASTSEVLVFTVLVLGLAREWCRALGSWRLPGALLVSALSFGLFHFTYPPPWASVGVALGLSLVWMTVNAVFLTTRTVLGAILFNNCMAMIGFLQNGLTLPLGILPSLAMWLLGLAASLGLMVGLSRTSRAGGAAQHAAAQPSARG